jgi:hypothetical protein
METVMTTLRLLLPLLLTITLPPIAALAQAGQPIPPGRTAANNATRQAEKVEPPAPVSHTISAAELQKQADELLSLAQQVHIGAERATQGILDKDLNDKLKRIEKLSKKLRSELAL